MRSESSWRASAWSHVGLGVLCTLLLTAGGARAQDSLCCPADLVGDGEVGSADLAVLLGAWGGAGPGDLDGSRVVDSADLAILLGAWGACDGDWVATFGGMPGANGSIFAAVHFDDGLGGGSQLYVGGDFTTIEGVPVSHIARWNGKQWQAIPGFNAPVGAFAIFDDGSGSALYAAASFGYASHFVIGKWTGTGWKPIGAAPGGIRALAVFDDGSGPALFAGGKFLEVSGVPALRIAKWNGVEWSAVGAGFGSVQTDDAVQALAVYDDGSGSRLYAGGTLWDSSGDLVWNIASWNGGGWKPLGTGVGGPVHALAVYEEEGHSSLYVGGNFLHIVGVGSSQRIARWDGAWTRFEIGCDGPVHALTVVAADAGKGSRLWVGGSFSNAGGLDSPRIAAWDGESWSALAQPGGGPTQSVSAIVAAPESARGAATPVASIFGDFLSVDGVPAMRAAARIGADWLPIVSTAGLAGGRPGEFGQAASFGLDAGVNVLLPIPGEDDSSYIVAGSFTQIAGFAYRSIAAWNGMTWTGFGDQLSGSVRAVTFAEVPSGDGLSLYAAGNLALDGGTPQHRVVRWTGSEWVAVGGTFSGNINALAVFDSGSGPELIAAGLFYLAEGLPVLNIARWNGTNWLPLGGGTSSLVNVLAVGRLESDAAPCLYVGGAFQQAGGLPIKSVARWDGSAWSAVGSPQSAVGAFVVQSLAILDESLGGPALVIGGGFQIVDNGEYSQGIARFDGDHWRPLESQHLWYLVQGLRVVTTAAGSRLYFGGNESIPGNSAPRIGVWDGVSIRSIEGGFDAIPRVFLDRASSPAGDQEAGSPRLLLGGAFTTSHAGDSFLTTYGCGADR